VWNHHGKMGRDGTEEERPPPVDVTRLEIRVIPRARRDEIGGERNGRLVVRTTAAPVDDAANQAVRRLVAQHFGVPTRAVEVTRGQRSRDKTLLIHSRR
jgi:uncharacterized protein YggU (UPF0235/DUF167 family)